MSWGEVKKINSDMCKPLDVLIEEKTGAVNATGGTATSGGIFAKLNKLLTDWTTARAGKIDTIDTNVGTLINGRVVKSVQTGHFASLATIGTANTEDTYYVDISIGSVNMSKCFVIFDGLGDVDSFAYSYNADYRPVARLISTNVIRISMMWPHVSAGAVKFFGRWQIVEFY